MKRIFILCTSMLTGFINAQWLLNGNSGTMPQNNFLGTIDNQPLVIRTNNKEQIRITPNGRFLFGALDYSLGWNANMILGGGNENATGLGNTIIGIGSLINFTTATSNTAVGANSLNSLTSGNANTAVGINAMKNSTTANYNVAVGHNALLELVSGNGNVAVGITTMGSGVGMVGNDNTTMGESTLRYITLGDNNTIIGAKSLRTLKNGSNNISLGRNNISTKSNANDNIFIGNNLESSSSSPINELNIGNWIRGNNGTIGIGDFAAPLPSDGVAQDGEKYKLFVKDGIKTEKVKVDIAANNGWADYVFKKNYQLPSINQVKAFIEKNGHLPEVPAEKEVLANGVELKSMNILLLKKVEELTLYIIQQEERIKNLENKNNTKP